MRINSIRIELIRINCLHIHVISENYKNKKKTLIDFEIMSGS
jgi:hypothetical protein